MYSIIYADPPWDYAGQVQHTKNAPVKSAIDHYNTMTLSELKQMKVKEICEKDCLLFLWTSSPHLQQAIELIEAWGFKYMTIAFIWDKQKLNPGYYTMSQCEICLVGKKGKIPSPRGSRRERQFLSELRREHSKKPDEIRERIHRMFPTQKKLEMFARQTTSNFDVFGNEVDNSITLDPVQ
jgi:N6-adenosine-specific RNA methylase IME4